MINAKSSLLIRRPTKEELDTCERVEGTARNEWGPQSPTLVEMENIAFARLKYGASDSGDRRMEIFSVIPTTVQVSSTNIGTPRYLGRHLSVGRTDSFHHPHYAYQQLSESRRVLSHISGTLDDDIFVQRMVGSVQVSSVSTKRHAGMDPARLARTFGIGLPTAEQTLEVTTQHSAKRGDYPHVQAAFGTSRDTPFRTPQHISC